ncbi:unnamed protein product [Diabrotica balteata]|uniref:Uncharacterized protein n=1 Tax=Diabrotica balteata TaxID=107213 RepID=A0A9N9X849_DIABA|nr:unnamed protein product [Diabrotica balteata]
MKMYINKPEYIMESDDSPSDEHLSNVENEDISLSKKVKKSLEQYVDIQFEGKFFPGQITYVSNTRAMRKVEDQGENEEGSSDYSPKVQIIAASGNNIIAVANPALAMSPAIIPPLHSNQILEARENRTEID